jgi:hypothetical protein
MYAAKDLRVAAQMAVLGIQLQTPIVNVDGALPVGLLAQGI